MSPSSGTVRGSAGACVARCEYCDNESENGRLETITNLGKTGRVSSWIHCPRLPVAVLVSSADAWFDSRSSELAGSQRVIFIRRFEGNSFAL